MDLSILIPARNEIFLNKTIEDILSHIEAETEIIVVLDGALPADPIPQHERVTVLYHNKSVGQRAATNQAAKLARGKYVMKLDAHCAMDQGFDRKMLEAFAEVGDDVTMVPAQYNLHVFNWKCNVCGKTWYQGPTPEFCCKDGDGHVRNEACSNTTDFSKDMVWKPRLSRRSEFWRFDKTLHFQYWGAYKERPEAKADLAETMSLLGACWMLTKDKYFELNICDENHGSWGQQGVEVACKTWLSGGRLITNKRTWFSHLFRTQGGDFGFPYPNNKITEARKYSQDLWLNNKWDKAIHPLSWLIEKFNPPEWNITKGILYYTDNSLAPEILQPCQKQLLKAKKSLRLVSVSLKPIDFGENITLPLERGYLTMAKQILAGLQELDTDIVYFTEHDVLYHASHFDFIPIEKDVYYYNMNCWQVRLDDGHAIIYDTKKLSGLCAYRTLLIEHYQKRIALLEAYIAAHGQDGLSTYVRQMGFEPGTHNRPQKVDDYKAEGYYSRRPNLDIRHNQNLTPSRWSKDQFRDQRNCQNWQETDGNIPGWGVLANNFKQLLASIV